MGHPKSSQIIITLPCLLVGLFAALLLGCATNHSKNQVTDLKTATIDHTNKAAFPDLAFTSQKTSQITSGTTASETTVDSKTVSMISPLDQKGTRFTSAVKMLVRSTPIESKRKNDEVSATLLFPRFQVTTEIVNPSLQEPILIELDLAEAIQGHGLTAVYEKTVLKDLQGTENLRKLVEKNIQDPTKRKIAMGVFSPEATLKILSNAQADSCLTAASGKSVGETWSCEVKFEEQALTNMCHFDGWTRTAPQTARISCEAKPQNFTTQTRSGDLQTYEYHGTSFYLADPSHGTLTSHLTAQGDTVYERDGQHIPGSVKIDVTTAFQELKDKPSAP